MALSPHQGSFALLKAALQTLLKDQGFQIPSLSAKEAHLAASEMQEWLVTNAALATPLVEDLTTALTDCIPGSLSAKSKMWGTFHHTRTSARFTSLWDQLMALSLKKPASPIFYQYVTDVMFKDLVKGRFPTVDQVTHQVEDSPELEYEESNALRNAAGYVPHALRERLERGSHPLKEELILCLVEMCEDNDDTDSSADWTKQISRGGLKLVKNKSYQFFHAMEMYVRRHFTVMFAPTISAGSKVMLVDKVATDDVLFYWSMLAVEWEEEENVLLRMIIDLWVTIRGFSFATSWLEMYKQVNKKTAEVQGGD